jgi:hypothetical protein
VGKRKCIRRILAVSLVVLVCAAATVAQSHDILSGREVLKARRQQAGPASQPAYEKRHRKMQPADPLMQMIPADSLLCVRVNHFDYTLGQIDRFLAGVSPIPRGASILVRTQLANLLGSPELAGVNTNSSFAFFAMPADTDTNRAEPSLHIFVGAFIPATDYNLLVSSNANVTEPDEKGMSKIASPDMPQMLISPAGDFAFLGPGDDYDRFVRVAEPIRNCKLAALAEALTTEQLNEAAGELVWLYADVGAASGVVAQSFSAQLEVFEVMRQDPNLQSDPSVNTLKKLFEQTNLLTLTVRPKPEVCTFTFSVSANTTAGNVFVPDCEFVRELVSALDAKKPADCGRELETIKTLLAHAEDADFVGLYNLAGLSSFVQTVAPVPLDQADIQTKTGIAFALRLSGNTILADIAIPKEHLTEIAAAFQSEPPESSKHTTAGPQPDNTQPPAKQQPQPITATVRDLGVSRPFRTRPGMYQLPLAVELPEPAVAVRQAEIERAVSICGRDLLPGKKWSRTIHFPILADDHRTVKFDVEFAEPNEWPVNFEELAGTIEYITAGGSKEINLGVMSLEAGAESQLAGFFINHIEQLESGKTLLELAVDLHPAALQAVRIRTGGARKVQARQIGTSSSDDRLLAVELLVQDPLPPKARIILVVYEDIKKHTARFHFVGTPYQRNDPVADKPMDRPPPPRPR